MADSPSALPRILVADDDVAMCALLEELCASVGHVTCALGGPALRALLDQVRDGSIHTPDLLVTDVRMPDFCGFQALRFIARHQLPLRVILVTAFGDRATHVQARALGAACLIDKPFDAERLIAAMRAALARRRVPAP